jgi:hypothetical protein
MSHVFQVICLPGFKARFAAVWSQQIDPDAEGMTTRAPTIRSGVFGSL